MDWPPRPSLLHDETALLGLAQSRASADSGPPKPPRQKLSCAECRRLKLKCSRVWPCTSCVKRQCQSLCPNETMKSESRVARQKEIAGLLERISGLEAALSIERGRNGTAADDCDASARQPASTRDSFSSGPNLIETVGNLTLHSNEERSRFLGPGSASALIEHESSEDEGDGMTDDDVMSLSDFAGSGPLTTPSPRDFPFNSSGSVRMSDMVALLPSRDDVIALGDLYYEQFVHLEPLQRDVWLRIHVPMAFREPATDPWGERAIREVHPHRLALVFAILACGSLNVSGSMPDASARAHTYLSMAQACLSGSRFISHPTIAATQCLLVMCQFHFACGRVEAAWPTSGLALRLAQASGLHRDPAAWSISQPECDQRRALWQDCLHIDSFAALMLGRPCGISTRHQDAHRPTGEGLRWHHPVNCDGERGEYHLARWTLTSLIHKIVDHAFSVEKPTMDTIMRLDSELREFSKALPESMRFRPVGSPEPSGAPASLRTKMQRNHLALFTQEISLFLHRTYFAQALRESPDEPLRSPFAGSVVAVVLEASTSLTSICQAASPLYAPGVPFRRGIVPAFGAAVCQAAIIIRSPGSLLARNAWDELCATVEFVERASVDMDLAAALLPRLRRLQEQGLRKLQIFYTGSSAIPLSPSPTNRPSLSARLSSPPSSSPPKFRHSPRQGEEDTSGDQAGDEEEIRALGGEATLSFREARSPAARARAGRAGGLLASPGLRTPLPPSTPTRSSIMTLPDRPLVVDGIDAQILDRIFALKPSILQQPTQPKGVSIPDHATAQPTFDFSFLQPLNLALPPAAASHQLPFHLEPQQPLYSAAFPPVQGHEPGGIASLTSPLDPATFWSEELAGDHAPLNFVYAPHLQPLAGPIPPVTPRTVFDDLLSAALGSPTPVPPAPPSMPFFSPAPSRPWSPV